jgi:hypothetical protein
LPATLRPNSARRKLWVVLAFGALRHEADNRRQELDLLRDECEATKGALGGLKHAEAQVEDAVERCAALSERLPIDAPDDWLAVGSRPLFDEYERKLREDGKRFNPTLRDKDVPLLRRQMEAICATAAPPFAPDTIPALTNDPTDDPIVYGALLADADYLVSNDNDIVPKGQESHEYEHEERKLLAVRSGNLMYEVMGDVDWSEIDGSLLATVFGASEPETPAGAPS